MAYLVDWSLTDEKGKRMAIESDGARLSAINSLSVEGFAIISAAVKAHVEAMELERAGKKPMARGKRALSMTSGSVA